jgi:hypothetical protein
LLFNSENFGRLFWDGDGVMAYLLEVAARRALLVYDDFDVIIFIHRNRKN